MTTSIQPASHSPPDRGAQFKHCLRQRLRLAREIAALRARFATAVQEYERVLRTMQLLAPTVGLSERDVGHPTDPEWGPSALVTYADGFFLKGEQDRVDRLLHSLP